MPPKLGILAGEGGLPSRIAIACREAGRDCLIVAFEGVTDATPLDGFPHFWTRLGTVAGALKRLKKEGVAEVLMAGPMKRPSLSSLKPDLATARIAARIAAHAVGDDQLLSALVRELESQGFRVIGIDDVLGELVMPEGPLGKFTPDDTATADIARGTEAARLLGMLDIGQSVVVQQGMVLGVEAIEGTDALLRRVKDLCREGKGGVLVKMKKPQQERRADLPTIGVETVQLAAAAGLRGIAVEAGGALAVDHGEIARHADALDMFVVGIRVAG